MSETTERLSLGQIVDYIKKTPSQVLAQQEHEFWGDIHTLWGNIATLFKQIKELAAAANIGIILIGTHHEGELVIQGAIGGSNALQNCVRATDKAFEELMKQDTKSLAEMACCSNSVEFEEAKQWAKDHVKDLSVTEKIAILRAEGDDFIATVNEIRKKHEVANTDVQEPEA